MVVFQHRDDVDNNNDGVVEVAMGAMLDDEMGMGMAMRKRTRRKVAYVVEVDKGDMKSKLEVDVDVDEFPYERDHVFDLIQHYHQQRMRKTM